MNHNPYEAPKRNDKPARSADKEIGRAELVLAAIGVIVTVIVLAQ